MKHIKEKEYKWSFNRVNSKEEILFSHSTNETTDGVSNYLDSKNIKHELTAGAGSTMFWIYFNDYKYAYFSTSGRWAPWNKGGYPDKHYRSKGIEDFYTRFLLPKQEFTLEETIESVEKILNKNEIDFVRKGNTVILTTKLVPRKDGKGNRKQYAYSYTIGTGRWKPIREDKEGMYKDVEYKSGGIEWFLKKHFWDTRTNPTFT